ncbi:hypothetical protein NQ176_g8838 [Zarea fungicola]|uniref:Uncharacterized protein n=1 Tax=Zarea fungicola TaxID=93591 RepID=A0ACC1MQN2_9HYPO|nr:hypothetical protein NQ176_g8838 [Lecanicillium fungicola]
MTISRCIVNVNTEWPSLGGEDAACFSQCGLPSQVLCWQNAAFLSSNRGNVEIVQLLLKKDKSVLNSKDDRGLTPLSWAAQKGSVPIVQMLLAIESIEANMADNQGWTPLCHASWSVHDEVVELLAEFDATSLELKTNEGKTPISLACENDQFKVVRRLRKKGVDIDTEIKRGGHP